MRSLWCLHGILRESRSLRSPQNRPQSKADNGCSPVTPAVKAAGEIHSDIEKGFIRAEVVRCEDLLAAGSIAAAKEKAQVRLEGKDYIVQEGDVILFRHSG